jgi:hypothetical protein
MILIAGALMLYAAVSEVPHRIAWSQMAAFLLILIPLDQISILLARRYSCILPNAADRVSRYSADD